MNKRGDVSILVLVFLVLIVTGAAIVSFYLSLSNQNKILANVNFIDNIYLQEQDANFYLEQAGENAFIKTYSNFVSNGDYLKYDSLIPYNNVNYIGSNEILNIEQINSKFKEQFDNNFIKEFQSYKFDKGYLKELNSLISNKEFTSNFDGESLVLTFKQFKFNFADANKNFKIDYTPDLVLKFKFKKYKLPSFIEINNVKTECLDELNFETPEDCFKSNLVNFEVSTLNNNGNSLIQLKTKSSYLIGNYLKPIIFGFVKL